MSLTVPLQNVRVQSVRPLVTPLDLQTEIPFSEASQLTVSRGRAAVEAILEGRDHRLLAVVGPCSIHDPASALEYARRLVKLREELIDFMEIVMRVYFEKPRTILGWKGLINDPHLDGSHDTETGLRMARQLLSEITAMGLPTATEFLDPIVPQYLADGISWAAVGARTTESQGHREMASGLSMPVGFKNGTDGDLQTAIDALRSARHPHAFLGLSTEGATAMIQTTGNPHCHLVMRGGRSGTNYDSQSLKDAADRLESAGMPPILVVDCSHANSGKQHHRQIEVWNSVVASKRAGGENSPIVGAMLESFLEAGNQPFPTAPDASTRSSLKPGVSITDACLGWAETEALLRGQLGS